MTVRTKCWLVVVLFCIAGGVLLLGERAIAARDKKAEIDVAPAEQSIPVLVSTIAERAFYERIQVQGNLKAAESVQVPPRGSGGVLENIFVNKGDVVTKGKTVLFQVEDVRAEQNLEIAQQQLNGAKLQQGEQEISLQRAKAEQAKAKKDMERYRTLYEKGGVSLSQYEDTVLRHTLITAEIKAIQQMVRIAKESVRQAESRVTIAKKDMSDTKVEAPLTGVVTQRFLDPGALAGPSAPVIQIEDLSTIKATCFLPYQVYERIQPGITSMRISMGDRHVDGLVSYKSPTIDPQLRTFEVESLLREPPEGFTAGAMVQADILLSSKRGVAVLRSAVQKRQGQDVIFIVEDGKAKAVPVTTGIEWDGYYELLDARPLIGSEAISEGQTLVDDGSTVRIRSQQVR